MSLLVMHDADLESDLEADVDVTRKQCAAPPVLEGAQMLSEASRARGDGAFQTGEQCHDGKLLTGDGCTSTCNVETSR